MANSRRRRASKRSHGNGGPEEWFPLQGWPRVGLALCGGGLLGVMYELGALKALDEALEPEMSVSDIDMVVGTSAGAIVGMLLANGVKPAEASRVVMENRRDPLNFHWTDVFLPPPETVAAALAHEARKAALAAGALLRGRVVDPVEVVEEMLPSGLLSLEPVRRYLGRLSEHRGFPAHFRDLPMAFWVTALDLDTAERVLFGPGENQDVPVVDAVVASCAIPGVYAPVSLKGRELIDGGTGSAAHIDVLMHAGARTVVVVNPVVPIKNDRRRVCIPALDGTCASLRDRGVHTVIDQAFRIFNYNRLELGLARFRASHPEVKVVRLEPDPAEMAAYAYNPMDYTHRKTMLEFGYNSTKAQLEDGKIRRALLRELKVPPAKGMRKGSN
ncbi:MAG: patatin-like phospholipase family protein [Halobacteria archaeon]